MTDDDARDFKIHTLIENACSVLGAMRQLSRADVLGGLIASCNDANPAFDHAVEAICVSGGISRADLEDRLNAVLELDAEEERERQAIRSACEREEAA